MEVYWTINWMRLFLSQRDYYRYHYREMRQQ